MILFFAIPDTVILIPGGLQIVFIFPNGRVNQYNGFVPPWTWDWNEPRLPRPYYDPSSTQFTDLMTFVRHQSVVCANTREEKINTLFKIAFGYREIRDAIFADPDDEQFPGLEVAHDDAFTTVFDAMSKEILQAADNACILCPQSINGLLLTVYIVPQCANVRYTFCTCRSPK